MSDQDIVDCPYTEEPIKIGITAPQSVAVHRKEVFEAIRQENIEAAQVEVKDLRALARVFRQRKQQEGKKK